MLGRTTWSVSTGIAVFGTTAPLIAIATSVSGCACAGIRFPAVARLAAVLSRSAISAISSFARTAAFAARIDAPSWSCGIQSMLRFIAPCTSETSACVSPEPSIQAWRGPACTSARRTAFASFATAATRSSRPDLWSSSAIGQRTPLASTNTLAGMPSASRGNTPASR